MKDEILRVFNSVVCPTESSVFSEYTKRDIEQKFHKEMDELNLKAVNYIKRKARKYKLSYKDVYIEVNFIPRIIIKPKQNEKS